jgi:hypothetical protein
MAAIALAESSGNPNAKNPNDNNGRQTSWGLWQISDGTHNEPVPNILDAKINAQEAVKKYKGPQGIGAWGTYSSGAYKQFMKGNVPPDLNLPAGSTPSGGGTDATQAGLGGDLGSAIGQGFAAAFGAILQPIISFIIWGSEIALGGGLILVGMLVFIANTDKGREVTRTVGGVAVNGAKMALAPETEAIPSMPRPIAKPRRVTSKEEFEEARRSGYNGPVRHDY